jgi:peptidoglycan biosynthesis protein MviN/MurJ (putative lipid II flippase)
MSEHGVIHSSTTSASDQQHRRRTFLRHLVEMFIAMMLGMCLLGMAFRGIHTALFGGGFDAAWRQHAELAVFAMTFNMTLPMVLWMHHRGHTWERCGEMAGAMFVLALVVLVPFWAGAISSGVAIPLEMALMLPAMIGVMALRYDEYATHAPAHSRGSTPGLAGS